MGNLVRKFLVFFAIMFAVYVADCSPAFPKTHKVDRSFKIKNVLIKQYSNIDWQRISEFFLNKENTGRRCVLRTDQDKRSGTYFIVTTSKPITSLPQGSKIKIEIIKDKSFQPTIFELNLPDERPSFTSELYCGITDQNIKPNRIMCWKISIIDKNGSCLMSRESYMWR